MRSLLGLVALCWVSGCSRDADSSSTPNDDDGLIFRQVSFGAYAPVRLGERLSKRAPASRPYGAHALLLVGAPFGGPDSVFVRLDSLQRVTELEYVYPTTRDFAETAAGYDNTIGKSAHTTLDSAAGKLERAVWEDSLTRLTLTFYHGPAGHQRFASTLTDLRNVHP